MTVKELIQTFEYRVFCLSDENREVKGGYTGDLLSWVMGKLTMDHAWVTIMSNVNIVAVATLADPACIILTEHVIPDEETVLRARQQGVTILGTEKDSFSVCCELHSVL